MMDSQQQFDRWNQHSDWFTEADDPTDMVSHRSHDSPPLQGFAETTKTKMENKPCSPAINRHAATRSYPPWEQNLTMLLPFTPRES
jgi:hypothetical protein